MISPSSLSASAFGRVKELRPMIDRAESAAGLDAADLFQDRKHTM